MPHLSDDNYILNFDNAYSGTGSLRKTGDGILELTATSASNSSVVTFLEPIAHSFTPARLDGIRYMIEVSTNLADWPNANNLTPLLSEGQNFIYQYPADISSIDRVFLRLRVNLE